MAKTGKILCLHLFAGSIFMFSARKKCHSSPCFCKTVAFPLSGFQECVNVSWKFFFLTSAIMSPSHRSAVCVNVRPYKLLNRCEINMSGVEGRREKRVIPMTLRLPVYRYPQNTPSRLVMVLTLQAPGFDSDVPPSIFCLLVYF